jgi:hypothetical protein
MDDLGNEQFDKILVYLGPSLPLKRAKAILPQAIYRPPARQGDILTDLINFNPDVIILIDAEIRQNLSPWHKEIVYALQYPGVKRVYGAASMGALRAAELDFIGMIGIGQIYQWYKDGVTEDDAEVVVNYTSREGPEGTVYYPLTVPLADIRAGVEDYKAAFPDKPAVFDAVSKFFQVMQKTFYMDRTPKFCEQTWDNALAIHYPYVGQKEIDTIETLTDFRSYKPAPKLVPNPDHLSNAFQALYDRDRRIKVKGKDVPQQHIDSYLLLHNPEYERICWDSANQELALLLCNALFVTVSLEEVERESNRFQQRCGIETISDFAIMLENNGWTRAEYDRLMVQNARIHKLQHALTITKHSRRNTRAILDYLRTNQAFDYWAIQAAQKETVIEEKGIDTWAEINLDIPVWKMLADHLEAEGLDLKCSQEEYLLETGFSNQHELGVALHRLAAARQEK